MRILKETFAAPRANLAVVRVLTVVSMQAVRALTPLSVDTCYLTTFVAQGELLGQSELRQDVVLIPAPITLVAIVGQVEQIAKVAALGKGFVIKGSDGAEIGRE